MRETIAAFATASGAAGLSVLRIAGDDAARIAERVFSFGPLPGLGQEGPRTKDDRTVTALAGYRAAFGYVHQPDAPDKPIDQCVLTRYRKPRSYTGEEQVELSVHGGAAVRRALLGAVLEAGARPAEPGEFSKLAFLNGKMDLAQAEAVMDMIQADTERQQALAVTQMQGAAARFIKGLRDEIYQLLASLEVEIEYPEYEDFAVSREGAKASLDSIIASLEGLARRNDEGRILRDGLQVVLIGEPNVGKSSLLNALAGEERAIVTSIPGTTRDTLELRLDMAGIPLYIYDTAGIRASEDVVEQLGVKRSLDRRDKADLLLMVAEAEGEADLLTQVRTVLDHSVKPFLLLCNKIDLSDKDPLHDSWAKAEAEVKEAFPNCLKLIPLSAKVSTGLRELREAIRSYYENLAGDGAADFALTSLRQQKLLLDALAVFRTLRQDLPVLPSDIISAGIRQGMEILAEITGESVSKEMTDEIFARFCVGK